MVMVVGKSPPASAGDIGVHSVPGPGRPLEAGRAAHSSILVWRIPQTGEPGGLQSIALPRAGHN